MSLLLTTPAPSNEESIDSLVKKEQKKAGYNYRKTRKINNLATLILWAAAGLTIATLIYILGFIIYKGFRSENTIESIFIDHGTLETPLEWYSGNSVLIVNSKVRLNEITKDDLSALINGKPSNWGNINGQDLKVHPYMLDTGNNNFGKNTIIKENVTQLAAAVENQEGAFGLIPADEAGTLDEYKIKIIPIQTLALGVNQSVFEIRDNKKLRYIDGVMLKNIFRGKALNWKDVGGINLQLKLVLPPVESYEYYKFLELADISADKIPEFVIRSENMEEYYEIINNLPGSIGLMLKSEADLNKIRLLKYQYKKTGRNLQLWFLFEEPKRAGRVGGVSSIIVNTIYMVLLTVLFSTPLGIGAAIYLTEYAVQGSIVKILRIGTETLAGIPSIIFGLFGFIIFVGEMHLGIGLLSGTMTLTLMILPTIIRTSEEAIKAVPRSFRSGSLALGAGKWQTIYKVVIPAAAPGILTGVILAIGRAVGETAALMFTMGFDYRRVENLTTSARVLSTHLYQLVKEGISFDRAFATATILIVIILIVNVLSTRLVKRKY